MALLTYGALRQYLRKLKRNLKLRAKNFSRKPSLSTPDIRSTEYIWQEVFNHRIYSHPHLEIEAEALDVVFDVGANVGVFASWVAQEYSPRFIYCYEASPITFKHLRKNIEKLDRIHKSTTFRAFNAAVSNTEGDERKIYHRGGKIGASTLLEHGKDLGGTPLSVIATSLSQQVLDNDVELVDLLKIDVEGHYMEVLEGISDFAKIRRIVLECDWLPQGAPSHNIVVQFLEERGYSVVLDDPTKQNNITVYARQTQPLHVR